VNRQRPRTLVAAGLLLAGGCVAEPVRVAASDDADVAVTADDMRFDPTRIEVSAGATTQLHLRNVGGVVHDLVLASGWESGEVRPGEAITVTLEAVEHTTVAWCSVPGHREAGMELDVVVADGS
jgi:nitrite reductase (NO-forming)